MKSKAADDLDRHEEGGDGCGQAGLAFRAVMAMTKKNMIAGPAAMIVRAGTAIMAVAMVVPMMGMPRMNVIMRHDSSLAQKRQKQ